MIKFILYLVEKIVLILISRLLFPNVKWNISCKDGLDKGQKWYGPNRSRDIKKRWQEYTEELYRKELLDPDNHYGEITHLEPDILECEVKWASESITTNKASGGDGISVELFQIPKDDAVEVLHSICQQIWKTQQWPQDWKRSVSFQFQRKAMPKNAQTTTQLHSSHTLAQQCSKFSKPGFNST